MRRSTAAKRGAGIAAIAVLALAASACSSSKSGGSASGSAAKDPASVKGTVTWWDTSDATNEAPNYQPIIKAFEAKYPNIKVNYVNVPFSDAEDKFKTAAQSGSGAPDVLRADVGWTPAFAQLGYLQPLDGTPALANDSDYMPGPYASDHYNGKIYGVPQVTDTLSLLYNKDLLAKAGITTAPKTWDELKTDSLQIKAKTGVDGTFLNAASYYLLPFIYGEGGDIIDASAKKITVNDATALKAVGIAQDLVKSGAAVTDVTKDGYNNMQTAFKDGKVAMVVNGPWSTADDLKGSAFSNADNLGIATVPAGSVKAGAPVGGHNLVVYAGSKNLDASYLFIAYLNDAQNQATIAAKNNVLPTRTSAYSDPQVANNKILSAFEGPLKNAVGRPPVAGASDLFTPLDTDYQAILGGQKSPQAALNDAATQFAQILPGFSKS
ncbi:arabinogalactan oligomer/maltooligosaccharide transport system substrate-binding protein [Catenulispora sp. EB89]|uniref:extracellular solute-binding protein n=1 Tax=Catenulispora sp. EB89 TaxID=3156257 RepID=UPI003515D40C